MSCSPCSDRSRPSATLRHLAGASLVVVLATGCGAGPSGSAPDTRTDQQVELEPSPTGSGTGRAPLPPGPPVPEDAQIAQGELVITGPGPRSEVAALVQGLNGELVSSDERIGVHVARFPVEDVAALLEVRDALRAAGVDAAVNPELRDPTLGS